MAIKEIIIVRSMQIAKARRLKLEALDVKLQFLIAERDRSDCSKPNIFNDYEDQISRVKTEIAEIYQKIASGIIMRSRANWVEMGEKPTSYFLSLEKYNHNKRVIQAIRDPKTQNVIRDIYAHKDLDIDPDYLALLDIPQISDKH